MLASRKKANESIKIHIGVRPQYGVQKELKVVFGDEDVGKAQADGFIGMAVSGD